MDNYPLGAEFDPNAPWNQKDPDYIDCPDCNAQGYIYYDEDGNEVDEREYLKFPDKYEREKCYTCDGEGEIIVEEEEYWDEDNNPYEEE